MRNSLPILALLSFIGVSHCTIGNCQTYSATGSGNGFLALPFAAGHSGTTFCIGTTVEETAYIDPDSATIRQVGVFSLTADAQAVNIHESWLIPPQFPNLPESESADITLNIYLPGGTDLFAFDTGYRPVTWNYGGYSCEGRFYFSCNIQVSGSYSLTTGGETFTGSFAYSAPISGYARTFTSISTENYPSSIALDGAMITGDPWNIYGGGTPQTFASFTAANGYVFELSAGTALLAPEPNSLTILGCGVIGLALSRRRQP